NELLEARELSHSMKFIGYSGLVKTICSFILRGLNSRPEHINDHFKEIEVLPCLKDGVYTTDIFPIKNISKPIFNFVYPTKIPTDSIFYCLYRFDQGKTGRASLMCYITKNIVNIVVVKTISINDADGEDDAERIKHFNQMIQN